MRCRGNSTLSPCLRAFWDAVLRPAALFGPVDFCALALLALDWRGLVKFDLHVDGGQVTPE
jgi:hypothetical protein